MSPTGLLQPLPIPCQLWDDIIINFIDGLPNSNDKNAILAIVDRLSKFEHIFALSHPYTTKMVVDKFIEWIVKLHRMPRSIVSGRDPVFLSHF